jgi:hypothetical protein
MTEQCRVCFHKSKTTCPNCGGLQGVPSLNLPPCKACPNGLRIGEEVRDSADTLSGPSIASWTESVERYDFYGVDAAPSFDTLAAVTAANDARIQSIAILLRAYPERIGQVETLLQIGMGS